MDVLSSCPRVHSCVKDTYRREDRCGGNMVFRDHSDLPPLPQADPLHRPVQITCVSRWFINIVERLPALVERPKDPSCCSLSVAVIQYSLFLDAFVQVCFSLSVCVYICTPLQTYINRGPLEGTTIMPLLAELCWGADKSDSPFFFPCSSFLFALSCLFAVCFGDLFRPFLIEHSVRCLFVKLMFKDKCLN